MGGAAEWSPPRQRAAKGRRKNDVCPLLSAPGQIRASQQWAQNSKGLLLPPFFHSHPTRSVIAVQLAFFLSKILLDPVRKTFWFQNFDCIARSVVMPVGGMFGLCAKRLLAFPASLTPRKRAARRYATGRHQVARGRNSTACIDVDIALSIDDDFDAAFRVIGDSVGDTGHDNLTVVVHVAAVDRMLLCVAKTISGRNGGEVRRESLWI